MKKALLFGLFFVLLFSFVLAKSLQNPNVENKANETARIEEERQKEAISFRYEILLLFSISALLSFLVVLIVKTFIPMSDKSIRRASVLVFLFFLVLFYYPNTYSLPFQHPFSVLFFAQTLLFAGVWFFFGREPRVKEESVYEREPPYYYSPAIVRALINQWSKKPEVDQMAAELLDLCLKGKLKLEKIKGKKEFRIHILDPSTTDLLESEAMLLDLISEAAKGRFERKYLILSVFKKDNTPHELLLSELKGYLMSQPQMSKKLVEKWANAVKKEAIEMNFFSKKSGLLQYGCGTALLFGFSLFYFPVAIPFIIAEAISLPLLFPSALPNRTKKGALHYARWMKLKRFLEDFSNLKNIPPTALPLWEKYLVYSIPLGVAKKVQKAMNSVFRDFKAIYNSVLFNEINYANISSIGFGSVISSFSSDFYSAIVSAGSSKGKFRETKIEEDGQ